jgi:hypothetical protein
MKQQISNDCMGYQNYGGNKNHRNRNAALIKYIGHENKDLVNGEYYTYRELGNAAGVSVHAIKNRINSEMIDYPKGTRVATDNTVRPKQDKPFEDCRGGSKKHREMRLNLPRCETPSEALMAKWLSRRL